MRLILTSWVHLPRWEGWCTVPARLGSDLHILFEAAITQLLSDIYLKCKHENSRVLLAHERMKEVSATQAGPNPQICSSLVMSQEERYANDFFLTQVAMRPPLRSPRDGGVGRCCPM